MNNLQNKNVTSALKFIARNKEARSYFAQSQNIYNILFNAAKRYVVGETMSDALIVANNLFKHGYNISLEYMGEDTETEAQCIAVKNEFLRLIKESSKTINEPHICFDLSNIGLYISGEHAYQNLMEIAEYAAKNNSYVMISMEESPKTQRIFDIYYKACKTHSNIGITLQAHLFRSLDDISQLLEAPGKIRLVKGVYDESEEISFKRSEALDNRYLQLLDTIHAARHPIIIATHDPNIINEVIRRNYLASETTTIEMLHGVRPLELKKLHQQAYKTRICLAYGTQWFLHFCHRLAEYPPNILQAIVDCLYPEHVRDEYYI